MKKYISLLALLLVCAACSDDAGNDEVITTGKEELAVNAGVSTTVLPEITTRGVGDPAFTQDFDLFMKLTAPTPGSFSKYDAKYKTTPPLRFDVSQTGNKWYWDDNGGTNAKLNLLGVYPKNAIAAIGAAFTWEVKADQTAVANMTASDLLISKMVTNYTLAGQKGALADIEFHHAFSKLTFVLKKGEGFTDADFQPTLTTVKFKTKADVTIADANGTVTIANLTDEANFKPYVTEALPGKKTLSAIVLPGQTIAQNAVFATIDIVINGVTNPYDVELTQPGITFTPGKNYLFTITVNKTNTQVSATIVDWDEVDVGNHAVNISVDGSGTSLNNANIKDAAQLYMKVIKGNTEVSGLRSKTTYDLTGTKWNDLAPTLYWDDIPTSTTTYAHAILFNTTMTNPEDIYAGKSQQLNKAVTSLNFADMSHPFAKVNLKIRTANGAQAAVDLDELTKVAFNTKIQQFKEIDATSTNADYPAIVYHAVGTASEIAASTLSTKAQETESSITYDFRGKTIYIKPCTITNTEELLRIFQTDGANVNNQYPWKHSAAINFQTNKEYNITITLSKTDVAEVGVTIKAWENGSTIGGGATIKE